MPEVPEHRANPRVVRVTLGVIAFAVVGLIGAVLYLSTQGRRENQLKSQMKALGHALHDYHDVHKAFPPAYVLAKNERTTSWRALVLREVGHGDLHRAYRFNESWESPHNRSLQPRIPDVYVSPRGGVPKPGVTHMLAVVDPRTAWPEQHSMTLEKLLDGPSLTVFVVEAPESKIVWTEPKDLSFDEALEVVSPPVGKPDAKSVVLMGDGAVRSVSATINREIAKRLLTASSNLPLPGVAWATVSPARLGPPQDAEKLPQTVITPIPATPIPESKNVVHCAVMSLAWEELRKAVGGAPIHVSNNDGQPSMLAAALNDYRFKASNLDPDSYFAAGGRYSAGAFHQIQQELKAKWPDFEPRQLTPPRPVSNGVVYAALRKQLPFAQRFESLPKPLVFQGSESDRRVEAFGIEEFADRHPEDTPFKRQIDVLHYQSDEDFLVKLLDATHTEMILLAKLAPAATLQETIDQVQKRFREAPEKDRELKKDETLIIPKLRLNVRRNYPELIGAVAHPYLEPDGITGAAEVIAFGLDETGAILEAEAEIVGENGHSIPKAPPKPRKLIFDRPFLVILQQANGDQPYFAAWINNAELMLAAPGEQGP